MSETKAHEANTKVDAKSISQEVGAESRENNDQDANQLCRSRTDGTWYMYVVSNGSSTITGHRPGSREQVVQHAEWFVAELNARSGRDCKSILSWRRGRPTKKSAVTDDK